MEVKVFEDIKMFNYWKQAETRPYEWNQTAEGKYVAIIYDKGLPQAPGCSSCDCN